MGDVPIKIFSYASLAHAVVTIPLAFTPVVNVLGGMYYLIKGLSSRHQQQLIFLNNG